MSETKKERILHQEEVILKPMNGMFMLILNILLTIGGIALFIIGIIFAARYGGGSGVAMIIIGSLYSFLIGPILFAGLKVLKPNEAMVFTLFGKYHGVIKGEGFYFVNPFVTAVRPEVFTTSAATGQANSAQKAASAVVVAEGGAVTFGAQPSPKISLKAMTLNNDNQKINDQLGNPVVIGIVVVWKIVNTTKAVFNVDNYKEFLSIQCDSALRNIVRLYPYDSAGTDGEKSLQGSSLEISERLKEEIQAKVNIAGLEIIEAKITHLAYSQEIAAAMLQRQQASAIIDAKRLIVEGAVGMVEMALTRLSENDIVHLDEERKAAMVSNLLVVLCGSKDAQPIVNSGSLY